jgi:hypothetical protein
MWIIRFFKRYQLDLFFLLLVILFSSFPRFILLYYTPPNITGDEVTNLLDILRVIFGQHLKLFGFVGDGTEAMITVYWPVLLTLLFGIKHSLLALRTSVSILSILALMGFYIILRIKTSAWVSFVVTCLLAGNYVFLNFSRTGWVNMGVIFSGMFMLLCLEIGAFRKIVWWYFFAGFFAGLTTYGYHYGKILVVFVVLTFLFRTIYPNYWKQKYILPMVYFLIGWLLLIIPFLQSIFHTHGYYILLRPKTVLAFSPSLIHDSQAFWWTIQNQTWYTFRGFLLLDGKVMSVGLENLRYTPLYTPPVDPVIKLFFLFGLLFCLLFAFKKIGWWWIVTLSTLVTEFFSLSIPNFARGLFYIPFIYLIIGVFVYKVFLLLRKTSLKTSLPYIAGFLILLSSFLYYFDVSFYFEWMHRPKTALAREPAITNDLFSQWQDYEIKRIRANKVPLTIYQWERQNSQ